MALRIIIIEDEPATARNLKFLLQEIEPDIEVLSMLTGVVESVHWLGGNAGNYDLIFMDIRLNDGLSFDIFGQVTIEVPVIFVTAYNDYALQAFKTNGIGYILKPFDKKELEDALSKFRRLTTPATRTDSDSKLRHPADSDSQLRQLTDNYSQLRQLAADIMGHGLTYKQSFLVHFREKLMPLTIAEIAWFYTTNEIVYVQTFDKRRLVIDFTMEQLQEQLNPKDFFRVNRQFIVHRKAILEINFYFNGRLLLKTTPAADEKMLISKARVSEFKTWMNT